jgi:hypothetical protein
MSIDDRTLKSELPNAPSRIIACLGGGGSKCRYPDPFGRRTMIYSLSRLRLRRKTGFFRRKNCLRVRSMCGDPILFFSVPHSLCSNQASSFGQQHQSYFMNSVVFVLVSPPSSFRSFLTKESFVYVRRLPSLRTLGSRRPNDGDGGARAACCPAAAAAADRARTELDICQILEITCSN